MMNKEEMLKILAELLAMEVEAEPIINEEEGFVEVSMPEPLEDRITYYRYQIQDDEQIMVQKLEDGSVIGTKTKTFREIVWRSYRLGRVCARYKDQYQAWKKENNDIPYIETKINDDADGRPQRSFEFIENFWEEDLRKENEGNRNLRLLLAEYGLGKSSYCQGIRFHVAEVIKEPFLKGKAAFPFVFDLNRFRSGDFDKFIESELFGSYKVPLVYGVFEKLCQNGIFMVVLDAWDQMRSARQVPQVKQDLNQMQSLWEHRGRALITCRRSFYQQQLKIKGNLSQNIRLYKLNGFDQQSVIDYLEYKNQELQQKGEQALIFEVKSWVADRWNMNKDIFEKPLNLRLLVQHFNAINRETDFQNEKVDTYKFLEIVFDEWKETNNITEDKFLKELISQTLYSGLNRSISLSQYKKAIGEEHQKLVLQTLKDFDFIKIDDREDRIEFYLAAYQEYIWANFALQELEADPACESSTALIRDYLLIREVREWICTILKEKESDCLKQQLQYVKYKRHSEVGYCGSNALTLLCDLNQMPYYKEQLNELKADLWRRPLKGTDFRGMDLSGADLHGSDLEGADFSYTKLEGANFRGADLAQTLWGEHGEMKKCAFLNQKNALCVVAGTHNGGVLTYRIQDKMQDVVNLQDDVINDLAGDRGGVYTASSDGWVGYIDNNGDLKNVYIERSGLQSIAHTNNANCVYVGAENQEIYRFNWNTGGRHRIEVDGSSGNGEDRISDIHYYANRVGEDYVAYTLQDKHVLELVKLTGMTRGEVVGTGILHTKGLRFDEICFADEMLIYSVIGKGIFGMEVAEMIDEIPERELLIDRQSILPLPEANAFFLDWASRNQKLMVAAENSNSSQYDVYALDFGSSERRGQPIEIDWIFGNKNYQPNSDQIKGFSVSEDGEFMAFSGMSLSVFQKSGPYYALTGAPIKTKISCKDTDFTGHVGLSSIQVEFLKKRGAIFNNEGY